MEYGKDSLNNKEILGLITKAQAGDREALTKIIILVTPAVHRQAKRIVSKGVEHEELCQEGMFAARAAVSSYRKDAGASFNTYVNLCIRRRMLSVVERSNSEIFADFDFSDNESALLADLSAEEHIIQADGFRELVNSINNLLSDKEKRTLELFLNGYTYQEIAVKLETTPKAVESTLARVRRKLGKFKK